MSPRRGGEAAKFGARFEGRWTTRSLLDVLIGRVAGNFGPAATNFERYSYGATKLAC